MNNKISLMLLALACSHTFPALAECPPFDPPAKDQIKMIAEMPPEQCAKDLPGLHKIHEPIPYMDCEKEVPIYLKEVGIRNRAKGICLPTPPAPCSPVHLAIEEKCDNANFKTLKETCEKTPYCKDDKLKQSLANTSMER